MILFFLFLINSIMQLGLILNKKKFEWCFVVYFFAEPISIIFLWIIDRLVKSLSYTEIYMVVLIVIVVKFFVRGVYKRKIQN